MKHFWLLVLGVGLIACVTSEGVMQTELAETETARPTTTLTPEPTATDIPTQTPLPSATEDTCNQEELSAWWVPGQLALFQIFQLIEEAAEMSDEEWSANAERFQQMTSDAHKLYEELAEPPPPCAEEAERLLQVYLIQLENGWEAEIEEDIRKANTYFDAAFRAYSDLVEELEELGLIDN